METDPRLACIKIFANLSIVSTDALSLFGRHYPCDPDRIVAAAQTAVYTEFYCRLTNVSSLMQRHEFVSGISNANRASASADAFEKVNPGAYFALGETPPPEVKWLRFYFNVCPQGAIELMKIATSILRRERFPFRLKILLDTSVRRSDAAVLYLPVELWRVGAKVSDEAYDGLAQKRFIRSDTPLFSKAIRTGIALAEDPGTGASFGMHRSGLVARALAKAYLRGRSTVEEKWENLCDEFAGDGLSIARPYLNAGSQDIYDV